MKSSWRSPAGGSSVAPNTKIEPSEAVFCAWWGAGLTPIRRFHTVSLRASVNKGQESQSYIDFIAGAIPPSRDAPSNTRPPTTITMPKGRATRWLPGIVFSAKMMSAAVSIQAKFIIPKATSPTIRPAQQPRQSTPWSIPSRRAPLDPARQLFIRKNNGLLQRAWQIRFSGVNW
jgi:hypothetical protein